jgi:hypothetical protein
MYTNPRKDKSDDVKASSYEGQSPRQDKNILLGDFNAKAGRDDIFKPRIGNESSHETSNDSGIKSSKLRHI